MATRKEINPNSYMTPTGHQALSDELDHLMKVERPNVVQEVADAAAQGDRSENAEYIYGKKRLREIDRRVRWLSKRIKDASQGVSLTVITHAIFIALDPVSQIERARQDNQLSP
ncbi:MAG: hypothetical protein AAFS10_24650, partial [Myxococcota bacterium]